MIIRYLSHRRTAKALASLRIGADSPDPSLLAYKKSWMFMQAQSINSTYSPLDSWVCLEVAKHLCDKYRYLVDWLKYSITFEQKTIH